MRRPPAAPPPAATVAPVPAQGRGGAAAPASQPNELEVWSQRYRSDMLRMSRANSELKRRQVGAGRGVASGVPAEIREAQGRLRTEAQAVTIDLGQHNYTRLPQSLEAFEGDLKVIEEFLAK